jgi:hypothetical protein
MNQVDDFWDNLFLRLVELAEGRDGYKPTTMELTDPLTARYLFEHIVTGAWNLRTLYALYHAVNYNDAMESLRALFQGKKSKMDYLFRGYAALPAFPLINEILDTYVGPFVAEPGGPILATLLSHYNLNWGTNNCIEHTDAIRIDEATEITNLLNDIEYSLLEVSGLSSEGDDNSDYRLLRSIFKMLGMPTLNLVPAPVQHNPAMWDYLQFRELFSFRDTQGGGADKMIYYPVNNDEEETHLTRVVPQGLAINRLFWAGAGPVYSAQDYLQEANTANVIYGMLMSALDSVDPRSVCAYYTREDEWAESNAELDMSAADSVQDYIWAQPWHSKHQWAYTAIVEQEAEEHFAPYESGIQVFRMPHAHIGEYLRVILHEDFGIPCQR